MNRRGSDLFIRAVEVVQMFEVVEGMSKSLLFVDEYVMDLHPSTDSTIWTVSTISTRFQSHRPAVHGVSVLIMLMESIIAINTSAGNTERHVR